MYKLMIADDEPIVVEGIKFLIEDTYDDIEVIAAVHSGREAIEATNHMVPDIVLMDIKMPGINGIEAIEAIKLKHSSTKFVIISAYEQFEFAKQAVEIGVSDYILKPVNQGKIIEVINKVKSEIKKEWDKKLIELKNKEKFDKVIPILEHGFIYSLLLNLDYRKEMSNYQELFEISRETGYVLILEVANSNLQEGKDNKIATGFKGQDHYDTIKDIIKYKCKSIIGPMIINRITVVVLEEGFDNEYDQRVTAIDRARTFIDKVKLQTGLDMIIGIGGCYGLEKIQNSMEEALYALGQISSEQVIHVNDFQDKIHIVESYSYVDIKADQMHIIKLIESGKEEELIYELNEFLNKAAKYAMQTVVNMENIITELMVMALSSSHRYQLEEGEVGYSTYLTELRRQDNLIQLNQWCIQKMVSISKKIQSKKQQHVSKIVLKAIELIDASYNEEVTLVDMSKAVCVSPQYFSKIFKDEIGLSFIEYIRKKRIDIAKELLKSKDYSVKEICYQIGYNDPNYFSRVFKKIVGVSPTDYQ